MQKPSINLFATLGRSNVGILLLAALGAALGVLIFFVGTPATSESQAFISSPEFIIWFAINIALFALYPVILVIVWRDTVEFRRHLRAHGLDIALSALVLSVLFFLPLKLGADAVGLQPFPIEYFSVKITVIEGIGLLAGALPLWIAMWLARASVKDDVLGRSGATGLSTYNSYRERLDRFLLLEGLLLALFILTSAAMRQMALAINMVSPSQYPQILLLLMGGYYTLLLALVYLPAEATLRASGRALINAHFPLVDPNDARWAETYLRRRELEELLEVRLPAQQRFATLFTLLAPVASAVFSLLVGQ